MDSEGNCVDCCLVAPELCPPCDDCDCPEFAEEHPMICGGCSDCLCPEFAQQHPEVCACQQGAAAARSSIGDDCSAPEIPCACGEPWQCTVPCKGQGIWVKPGGLLPTLKTVPPQCGGETTIKISDLIDLAKLPAEQEIKNTQNAYDKDTYYQYGCKLGTDGKLHGYVNGPFLSPLHKVYLKYENYNATITFKCSIPGSWTTIRWRVENNRDENPPMCQAMTEYEYSEWKSITIHIGPWGPPGTWKDFPITDSCPPSGEGAGPRGEFSDDCGNKIDCYCSTYYRFSYNDYTCIGCCNYDGGLILPQYRVRDPGNKLHSFRLYNFEQYRWTGRDPNAWEWVLYYSEFEPFQRSATWRKDQASVPSIEQALTAGTEGAPPDGIAGQCNF